MIRGCVVSVVGFVVMISVWIVLWRLVVTVVGFSFASPPPTVVDNSTRMQG